MKLSHLILLSIVSIAIFYIQLWDHRIVIPLCLMILGTCMIYGSYIKEVNMIHISGIMFTFTALNHAVFELGLINDSVPSENQLLQGTIIYGTQLLFNIVTALLLIFRVQFSRSISQSKDVALTYFDGIFHWFFIYMGLMNLLAMLENIAWSYFEMKSWTFIYDNFEGLIYVAWSICCGTVLTMMICGAKSYTPQESELS
ncbi:hypothetical protein K5642_03355 [Pseudoalteromonas piscicida]|nr:hypothetical protein K5642_03355 [Pseudoalteromonas piscicida]